MLTEDHARELLAEAAATIEVGSDAGVDYDRGPRRPLWPVLVAAAVVVIAVVAAFALADFGSHNPVDPSDDVGRASVRVPVVFGVDKDGALGLLKTAKLDVDLHEVASCEAPGRALGTRPIAGTLLRTGDPVRLDVSAGPHADGGCAAAVSNRSLAWHLVDFANGQGPAPDFARTVTIYVDGSVRTLPHAEAVAYSGWGDDSPIGALRRGLTESVDLGDRILAPGLTVHVDSGDDFACGGRGLPAQLAGRDSVAMWFNPPDPMPTLDCQMVNVFRTGGQIDAMVLRTGAGSAPATATGPPNATDPDGIGASFVSWARDSGPAPAWADRVGLYLGGKRLETLTGADAADPTAWRVCAQYAGVTCPFSAPGTLAHYDEPVRFISEPPPTCRDTLRPLNPDVLGRPNAHLVVVAPAGTGLDCHGTFDIEVWSVDGAVFAVNLTIGGF